MPFVPDRSIEDTEPPAWPAQLKPDGGADAVEPDVHAQIDGWFHVPLPPSDGSQWQVWAASELAVAALRGVERECPGLRYHVSLSCASDDRRAAALARRFPAHDERFVAVDEDRVIVATGDIEDVAFLTGFPLRGALSPFVTVLARSADCVAVLYFDWDDDRFYVAETGGVVLRHVLWAASAFGLDIVSDGGEIFMLAGTPEYLAEMRAWIQSGSKALPEALR